jgi:hypothetical protein
MPMSRCKQKSENERTGEDSEDRGKGKTSKLHGAIGRLNVRH